MKYDLVVFDLDGTTLSTLEDLADACNYALLCSGFPTHTIEKVRTCVGSGIATLLRRTVPDGCGEEAFAVVLKDFTRWYSAHMNDKTRPYPGICEMMKALRNAGVRVAVNSNKADPAVQALCRFHFGDLVDMAVGEKPDVPRKPDPAGVNSILREMRVDPLRALYVGDSDTDILTARSAGIDCAWVSWGLRTSAELGDLRPSHRFDSAASLTAFILS